MAVSDKDLNIKDAMIKIFNLAIFPIIAMCFHPLYHVINSIFMGHIEGEVYLAALGLGGLTVGIVLLSIMVNFNGSLDTLIS
jgi:Na+-driven multidrug efflux pump